MHFELGNFKVGSKNCKLKKSNDNYFVLILSLSPPPPLSFSYMTTLLTVTIVLLTWIHVLHKCTALLAINLQVTAIDVNVSYFQFEQNKNTLNQFATAKINENKDEKIRRTFLLHRVLDIHFGVCLQHFDSVMFDHCYFTMTECEKSFFFAFFFVIAPYL